MSKLSQHWPAPFSGWNFHRKPVDFRGNLLAAASSFGTGLQALLRRRRNHARRFETDAMDLITRFGAQAYYEAEQLSKGYGASDGDRPPLHWARVKVEVARRHEIDVSLSGAMRWE